MKKKIVALVCAFAVLSTSQSFMAMSVEAAPGDAGGTTYYISNDGDNQNSGTSEGNAWQTLDKLENLELEPGDQILLESGSVFNGFIHLNDVHGTKEAPIKIGSYGSGNKPIINANGEGVWYQDYGAALDNAYHRAKGYVSSTILLYDVDFVEIENLEITNASDDAEFIQNGLSNVSERMDRTGVAGIAKDGGTMEHVYLKDLYIHNVDGNLQDKHMNNGGIQLNVAKPSDEANTGIARYDDVQITGCYVEDVHRAGIVVGYTYQHGQFNGNAISDAAVKKYGHTNIKIADNYVKEPGNDAIVVMYSDSPIIERNVSDTAGADLDDYQYWQSFCATIWPWKTKDAVFQYNEAFDTVGEGNGDGQAWDIDWSDGTIYQYNYSHNNGGGAMLVCLNEAYNGTFRYNLSYNDLGQLLTFQGNPEAQVYNNVFYVDGDRTTKVHHKDAGKRSGAGVLKNNIFYNASTANPNDEWEPSGNKQFSNNLYYGYASIPSTDSHAVVVAEADKDTVFKGPLTAPADTTGTVHDREEFKGFQLNDNSPAINAGLYVAKNGGKDFFGNKITGLVPDIGIHETNTEDDASMELYSDVYNVAVDAISGVPVGTNVDTFKKNLIYDASVTLEVLNGTTAADAEDPITDNTVLKLSFGDEEKTYSVAVVWELSSSEYNVSADAVNEVPKGTTAAALKENLSYNENVTAKIMNGDTEASDNDAVTDDMILRLSYKTLTKDYTIGTVKVYQEYSPSGMTAEVGSYQPNNTTEGGGQLALDDNLSTMWHTAWAGCNRADTWISIDMGAVQKVAMLKYVPRQGGGTNGLIIAYEIYVSDDGENWETPVAAGTWANDKEVKYAEFAPVNARYVKLVATDSKSQEAGKIFASAAEIRLGYEQ